MSEKRTRRSGSVFAWLRIAFAVCVSGALVTFSDGSIAADSEAKAEPLEIVFFFLGPARDGGWNSIFDDARRQLDESFGDQVTTSFRENVVEGPPTLRIVEAAIQDGANVVVSTQFGFGESMMEVAAKYPEVFFIVSQWDNPGTLDNFVGFVNAPEDAAYLAGIAAGYILESGGTVGWVDGFPIPYDIRTINGFALGLARSNPTATAQVVFTNDWGDINRQALATRSLIASGAGFISTSLNGRVVGEIAESSGVPFAVPATYGSRFAPNWMVTRFVYTWAPVIERVLHSIFQSTFDTAFIYSGLADGGVSIGPWGAPYDPLSEDAKADIAREIERLRNGGAVFRGPLTDKDGNVVARDGDTLSIDERRSMKFVLPNVAGVEF